MQEGVLETAMRQVVDDGTLARGMAYAGQGAVLEFRWLDGDARLVGSVRGSGRHIYVTGATIDRTRSGAVVGVRGNCSCPMAVDCKHVVALVLTAESRAGRSGGGTVPGASSRKAPWEQVLRRVTEEPYADADVDEGEGGSALGLQFELVTPGNQRGAPSASTARIRLRPVTPGRNGTWVRSQTGWSRLDYFWYRGPGEERTGEQLALLQELLALSRVQASRSFSRYGEQGVWLESIGSRRVWDLLAEAEVLGLPLVGAGRRPVPVALAPERGAARVDVTRSVDGIDVRPELVVGDVVVPSGSALLIGAPAHGVAWWTTAPGSDAPEALFLAALDAGLDGPVGELVLGPPLAVPATDEARFLEEFQPLLVERVAVTSSDGSVEVTRPSARRLELAVSSPGGSHCHFAWSWVRGPVGAGRRGALTSRPGTAGARRNEAEVLAAATAAAAGSPDLVERTEVGPRLIAEGVLVGMAAVDLVTHLVPALQAVDGVDVVVDGDLPEFRAAEGLPQVSLGSTGPPDRSDWLDLLVTVTVDGEDVPFQELFVALADGRSHLILPSGTYFPLDSDELRRLAELIAEGRALSEAPGGAVRVSRFQSDWWEELRTLATVDAQVARWEASVRSLVDAGDRIEHPVPSGLDAELRPYQLDGFRWLVHLFELGLGGVLADDMGLGKTVQALALICHVQEHRPSGPPFLVVAPTSVAPNWVAECRRFAPGLDVVAVRETSARRGVPLADLAAGARIVVTSYGLFRREFDDYDGVEWAGLFLDEAQFVKTHTSQAHRRARMLSTPFKVAVTGTPMENNLLELWSLLTVTAPGLLGDARRFAAYYRQPIERDGDTERLVQLRRRIRPLMLRRTKEQVAAELPAKVEQVLELELVPRHAKVYQAYLQRERQKVLGMLGDLRKHRFEIFRSLTLLRQASLDVALVDDRHAGIPSTKLDALMEMVGEVVEDGHRVLVFSQFTRFLRSARDRMESAGIEFCYLDGRTRNRGRVVDRFRSGGAPVFLISLKAGGFGLNLTEADYCILLDPWWNPAAEAQAVDRTHRIGQDKRVMVYRLVAKDTIEEKVMALKAKKAALFADVIDSGELASGALSAEDIRGLLE